MITHRSALREMLIALDRQKTAFAESHGPFLYLAALGCAPGFRGCGLGSMLLDRLCRTADAQRLFLYTEATSEAQRTWLRKVGGFYELLRHSVRPHAPPVYVMVRRPAPLDRDEAKAGSGEAAPVKAAGMAPATRVRPANSVRTR
jgi:ribosomal protein S18 acetylase RimI-like enzyme